MGVFEEAKIRVQDLQKRVQRINEAGQALSNNKNDKTAKSKFKVMYATLERLYEDFEVQLGILIKYNGKPGTEEIVPNLNGMRAEFEEQYFSCKILADEFLPESNMANSEESRFISRVSNASVVPLEKLTVAKFGGDPKAYTGFRNLFDTIVHENTNIRPVVKFGYLKSYLEGEPLKLIANLMLTDGNYELALSQLEARYANRRYITESHLDELSDAPNATFGNGSSIVQLLNTITSAIGALENLKYPVKQWSPILLHQLQKKLDHQLRAQWELAVDTTTEPTLAEFTIFLTKFSKSAMVSQVKTDGGQPKQKWSNPNRTMAFYSGTPSKEVSSQSDQPERKTFKCQVCDTQPGHLLIHCARFKEMAPKQRH
ncbi:Integrase catalytic domain-containing protein [Aphis craccivora]|uniref:Integrase catalytic domain-containing protein n=1 Tax=Aphis craccivora TaxID=307492 RepID=A0A6G0VM18_APHCR|nr:Integrase catalytic domain-containing protein [Aphis craccivora]